ESKESEGRRGAVPGFKAAPPFHPPGNPWDLPESPHFGHLGGLGPLQRELPGHHWRPSDFQRFD
ncbi:hypothetical protein CRENBAI_019578, partial [Crenichthys baileyi]